VNAMEQNYMRLIRAAEAWSSAADTNADTPVAPSSRLERMGDGEFVSERSSTTELANEALLRWVDRNGPDAVLPEATSSCDAPASQLIKEAARHLRGPENGDGRSSSVEVLTLRGSDVSDSFTLDPVGEGTRNGEDFCPDDAVSQWQWDPREAEAEDAPVVHRGPASMPLSDLVSAVATVVRDGGDLETSLEAAMRAYGARKAAPPIGDEPATTAVLRVLDGCPEGHFPGTILELAQAAEVELGQAKEALIQLRAGGFVEAQAFTSLDRCEDGRDPVATSLQVRLLEAVKGAGGVLPGSARTVADTIGARKGDIRDAISGLESVGAVRWLRTGPSSGVYLPGVAPRRARVSERERAILRACPFYGTVSSLSETMDSSRQSISRSVQALEGLSLVSVVREGTGRGVFLTDEGEAFLAQLGQETEG